MEETSYRGGPKIERFRREFGISRKKRKIRWATRLVNAGLEDLTKEGVNPLDEDSQECFKEMGKYADASVEPLISQSGKKNIVGTVVGASLLAVGLWAYSGCSRDASEEVPVVSTLEKIDLQKSPKNEMREYIIKTVKKIKYPKEKKEIKYEHQVAENGELVIKKRTYVIKDLPPKIVKAELDTRSCVDIRIHNYGELNQRYLDYTQIINFETKEVIRKKDYGAPSIPHYDTPLIPLIVCEGSKTDDFSYCLFMERICIDAPVKVGTYKFQIEVKDHYHTARSDPITIRVEEAK